MDARFQGVPGACPDRGAYSRFCTDPGADRGGQEAKCGDGLQPLEERLGGLSIQAFEFLTRLPAEIARFADCDVVLYQAGADPHVNDPLGGWLTTEQFRECAPAYLSPVPGECRWQGVGVRVTQADWKTV